MLPLLGSCLVGPVGVAAVPCCRRAGFRRGFNASPPLSLTSPPCQGLGIEEILEAVVARIPPPKDQRGEPLRALIFDSYYDAYKVRRGAEGVAECFLEHAVACLWRFCSAV